MRVERNVLVVGVGAVGALVRSFYVSGEPSLILACTAMIMCGIAMVLRELGRWGRI